MKIFLSVRRTFTDAQETYVRRIEDHLRAHNLVPQTVGRSYFSSHQPLKAIDILMNECVGSVVVALERTFIPEALDRRGSPKEQAITDVRLPTVWNQIEAAMAYVRGHPLLVLVQDGVKPEGLLEKGYDWYVLSIDIHQMPFTDLESTGVFADWKARLPVVAPQQRPTATVPQRTIVDDDAYRHYLTDMRKQLASALNDDELETLSFDLRVDYENLKGNSKEAKARELVLQCDRLGKMAELTELCRAMRPNMTWQQP